MILEKFFKNQLDLQKQINPNFDDLSYEEKVKLTKEHLLHLITEVDEVLTAVGTWKTHKIRKEEFPKISGITEELVDIVKFVINIALIWGITPREFIKKWFEKTVVNKYKFLQERRLISLKEKPVVIFDVDGVLNRFPEEFVEFVNSNLGTNFKISEYLELPKKIPYEKYRELKHEFYETRKESFTEEARKVLRELRRKKISTVLLTSRPISKYKRFFYEIVIGLKNQRIPFDVLIEDREKGLRIMKDFNSVLLSVDDEPYYVEDILSYGIKAYLYRKPYNRFYKGKNVIENLEEILNEV